jgi:hypothetical protein
MKQEKGFLESLYLAPQSVFSSKEVAILTKETNPLTLKAKLSYYVRLNKLIRIRRGFYAKTKGYNKKEFVTRLYTPSYIGFETVLAKENIIFQHYDTLFCASYLSREIKIDHMNVRYRKLKNDILLNRKGIIDKGTYSEASKERAFLDMLYIHSEYYFDNLRSIDWKKCENLVPIYNNKSLVASLKEYKKIYA